MLFFVGYIAYSSPWKVKYMKIYSLIELYKAHIMTLKTHHLNREKLEKSSKTSPEIFDHNQSSIRASSSHMTLTDNFTSECDVHVRGVFSYFWRVFHHLSYHISMYIIECDIQHVFSIFSSSFIAILSSILWHIRHKNAHLFCLSHIVHHLICFHL